MERKTKILVALLATTIVCTLLVAYMRFFVLRDFTIETSQECDPSENTCFVSVCDPEGGTECTGDPSADTSYFEVIQKPAKEVQLCNPIKESCPEITCKKDEVNCSIIHCSDELLETYGAVRCSDDSDQAPLGGQEESGEVDPAEVS